MEAAEAIESGHFVALGQCRIVEDGVDEVVDCAAEGHDGLADVNQLGGAFADDVHAEDLAGVAVEDELESSGGVAANLASSNFAIVGHADFVGNVFAGQLFLSLSYEADLGNGVNAVGIEAGIGGGSLVAEGAGGGDAALFHGNRSQGGKADDVAGGEDVFDFGLVMLVYGDAAAVIGFETGGGEVEVVDISLAADSVEQRVAGDLLFAFEIGDDGAAAMALRHSRLLRRGGG